MTPFVIVADMRTGSTLLSSTLDFHPDIRCLGEILHSDDLPDNGIPGSSRHEMSGSDLIRRVFGLKGWLAVGFRAMIFLPEEEFYPQWSDAWDSLHEIDSLRVIYLTRKNRLAQYTSVLVAQVSGRYHPFDDDPILVPENRPRVTVDRDELSEWTGQRDRLFELRRETLKGKASLEVSYEDLTSDWPNVIIRLQRFLGVKPSPLRQSKRKQETRRLSEVITNYHEVAHRDV